MFPRKLFNNMLLPVNQKTKFPILGLSWAFCTQQAKWIARSVRELLNSSRVFHPHLE